MFSPALMPIAILCMFQVQTLEKLPKTVGEAYEVLAHTGTFTDGPIGIAGATPIEHQAFVLLLKDPQAESYFDRLLAHGSLPGKLYALCGIHFVNRQKLHSVSLPFSSMHTKVETMNGCLISYEKCSALIPNILSGESTRSILNTVNRSRKA